MSSGQIPTLRSTFYKSISGTIGGATNNLAIDMTGIRLGFGIQVTNDDSAESITLKVNSNANDGIIVKAGETQVLNLMPITEASLTNSSGSTVSYRAVIIGEPTE